MRAVLLFSAVLHVGAIGGLAAIALRAWLNTSRREEPTVPESVITAGGLALIVAVLGTIAMWMGRSFGIALTTGIAAGLLSALAFLLTLGVMPHASPDAGPPSFYARISAASLVAALVLTEVIAFCFLIASAGAAPPWS